MTGQRLSLPWLGTAFGVVLGVSIPLNLAGRAAMQGAVVAALVIGLAVLAAQPRDALTRLRAIPVWIWLASAMAFAALLPAVLVSISPADSWAAFGRTAGFWLGGVILWLGLSLAQGGGGWAVRSVVAVTLGAMTGAVLVMVLDHELVWHLRGAGGPPLASAAENLVPLKPTASALAAALPVVVLLAWRQGGSWRLAGAAIALLTLVMVVLTRSRASVVGLVAVAAVALLVWAIRRGCVAWALGAFSVILAVVGFWVTGLPQNPYPDAVQVQLYLPPGLVDPHRQIIWNFVWERFVEQPWFGVGLNAVNKLPGANAQIPGMFVEFVPSHPHNAVLELLAEGGLVGAAGVFGVVLWVSVRLFRLACRTDAALPALLFWAGYWGASVSNFSIWAPWWKILLVVGMVLALIPFARGEQR